MKVRNGFVSNSSSSSFVVIDASKGYDKLPYRGTLVVDSNIGNTEFGWGPERITDIGSRIIFTYLQTQYATGEQDLLLKKALEAIHGHSNDYLHMLEEVIRENSNVKSFEWNITEEYDHPTKSWAYIDHQSNAAEGSNLEIFESKKQLKDFIFGSGSYIQLDNDNN